MHSDRNGAHTAVAIFVLQTMGSGIAVYGIPLYIAVFLRSGTVGAASLSLASTAFFITGALSAPVVSRFGQHNPIRALLAAVLTGTAAIAAMAVHPSAPVVITAFAALGAVFNGGFVVVGTAVLVRVFDGKPTAGMALSTSGASAGGILVAPLVALLLTTGPFHPGAFFVEAGGFLVVSVAAVALGRRGSPPSAAVRTPAPGRSWLRLAPHWPLVAGFGLISASQLGATSYMVAIGLSRNFAGAGLAVSVATGVAVASRWLGSAGIRTFGLHRWTMISFTLQVAGVALIGVAPAGWVLFTGAVLIGQSLGNTILIRSQVVVELFGVEEFPPVFAQFQTWATLGSAVGPFVLGQVFAASHDYTLAYLALCVINAVALPCLLPWLRGPRTGGPKTRTWSVDEPERTEGSPV